MLSTVQFLRGEFREIAIGSTNNPPIAIFLYSHHLSAGYYIDIVGRNSVLVTHESKRVNGIHNFVIHFVDPLIVSTPTL